MTSLFVLFATGALAAPALAEVDTSRWTCETCPFDKPGTAVTIEAGLGGVSDDAPHFGDTTGLQDKGAFAVLGGQARYRTEAGVFGAVEAADLGLDTRSLRAVVGREGLYTFRLGYSELPRHTHDGAMTPWRGVGSANLTLPFPAAGSTADMPLATTLRSVDVASKRSNLELGLSWVLAPAWTSQLSLRHDMRDGIDRMSGSFRSTATQLLAPVDQTTDQLEASVAYASGPLQARVAYQGSLFRNANDALTWANPFAPVVAGATQGQLALAPDNQFHQVLASAGYQLTSWIRASADVAFGRQTQDARLLQATLTPGLYTGTLPANSLDGKVDTFNANVRLTARLNDMLQVHASVLHDARDNRTPQRSWPDVSTDMFVGTDALVNQPFSFKRDRVRVEAELRAPHRIRLSGGLEEDDRQRTLQEVVTTRETTAWGKASAALRDDLSMSLKLTHGDRRSSTYGTATWVDPPENPLLRKLNLAPRMREGAQARLDATVNEVVSLGLFAEASRDRYRDTTIGLLGSRSTHVGAELSVAVSDQTQLNAFAQAEWARTRQAGSQAAAQADWWASTRDHHDVAGVGLRHSALKGRLELAGDVTSTRMRGHVAVDIRSPTPALPMTRVDVDTLRLTASWRYSEQITFVGGWWHERYHAQDWRIDGVLPDTLGNLLALGEQAPRYLVHAVRLGVRVSF